jgi:RNA polymerase-binding transcription factor DksA
MGPDGAPETVRLNLDEVAAELDAVATALERLDAGTYWSDEVTGAVIDDSVLAADPTARRNP